MVGPSRIRHENPSLGAGHLDQFECLANGPCATWRGCGGDAVPCNCVPKHHGDHCIGKGRVPRQAGIGFAVLVFPKLVFGRFDGTHNGCQPRSILVDANAKVDLSLARVVLVHLHKRKNFIGGLGLKSFKHHASPVATGTVGNMPHSAQDPS